MGFVIEAQFTDTQNVILLVRYYCYSIGFRGSLWLWQPRRELLSQKRPRQGEGDSIHNKLHLNDAAAAAVAYSNGRLQAQV